MAEILGTYPKARTSEADDAFDKAKRENGYTAFKGHDQGGGTVTMPKGMTPEQEAKWRAGLKKGQAAVEGQDYGTGFKWTEEDTQRAKDMGKIAGETAAEIAVAPYGLYKDLTEVQKLLAAGSVGAAVGAAGMAAAGPIGDAAKGASKVVRRMLQSGDKAQAKHLDDWLAGRRGPEGLDPEVIDSVMIMRPDLRTPEAAQRIRGEVEGALKRRQAQEARDIERARRTGYHTDRDRIAAGISEAEEEELRRLYPTPESQGVSTDQFSGRPLSPYEYERTGPTRLIGTEDFADVTREGEFKPDFSQVERRIRELERPIHDNRIIHGEAADISQPHPWQERAGGLPRDYDPSTPTGRYQGRTRMEVLESLSPSEMQALSRARSLRSDIDFEEMGDRGMGATQELFDAYGEAVEELRRLDLEFLLHTPPPKGGW